MQLPGLFLILALSTLSACGLETSEKAKSEKYDYSDYTSGGGTLSDDGTCEFGAGDGNSAVSISGTDIQALSFGKSIDLARLHAVHQTSARETIRSIRDQGIEIEQANTPQKYRCKMFDDLPQASSWANRIWEDRSFDRILLGIFLPRRAQQNQKGRHLIVIRPDTTRWTLLHEYAHALFEIELERQGLPSGDHHDKTLTENMDEWDALRKNCESRTDCTNPTRYLELTKNIARAIEGIVLEYSFEEIAIEHALSSAYSNGALRFVPNELFDAWMYAQSSLERAERYRRLRNVFVRKLSDSTWHVQDRTEIQKFVTENNARWDQLFNEGQTKFREIGLMASSKDLKAYGLARRDLPKENPKQPCSRHGSHELINELERLL
jgi:hypothetical protein